MSASVPSTPDPTTATKATDLYITGLRNQHAVETQAIQTIKAQMDRMEPYPELHSKMAEEITRSNTQIERLETLLAQHDTSHSATKEVVTNIAGTIAGAVHMTAPDEVLKNVMAAAGYKTYEISSYQLLITFAQQAGLTEAASTLGISLKEEQEMREWFDSYIPKLGEQFIQRSLHT